MPFPNINCLQIFALVTCLFLVGLPASARMAYPQVAAVRVAGAHLDVALSDGRHLTGRDLIGAELTIGYAGDHEAQVKINGAEHDPEDPRGERWLYHLLLKYRKTGHWQEFCDLGPKGRRLGFPVEGRITADGAYEPADGQISFTCTGGALAKCIRMGYLPWAKNAAGGAMLDHFRACLRMVRADYCGDGRPHTRDGTLINIYDRIGVQKRDPFPELVFEAAWGPDGAVCVRKTRIDAHWTLDDLRATCPRRIAGRIGPACSQSAASSLPNALIFNDSRDTRGAKGVAQ